MDYVGIEDETVRAKIKTVKAERYKRNIDYIRVNQYLLGFIMLAKDNGLTVGIATTASRDNIQNILTYFLTFFYIFLQVYRKRY